MDFSGYTPLNVDMKLLPFPHFLYKVARVVPSLDFI